MTLTSKELSAFGRVGAYAQHARHDARETTAHARAAFLARFETVVDPDRRLDPAERRRRADFARREHFARLAILSAQARRQGTSRPRQAARARSMPEVRRERIPTD